MYAIKFNKMQVTTRKKVLGAAKPTTRTETEQRRNPSGLGASYGFGRYKSASTDHRQSAPGPDMACAACEKRV